jgi:hypothetical protein
MKRLRWILIFLNLMLFSWIANSAVQVTAQVDSEQVVLGEPVTLSITVKSTTDIEIPEPRVPSLNGFTLDGSSRDSAPAVELRPQGGRMEFERVYQTFFNYVFLPQRLGRLKIPEFELNIDGKLVNTQAFEIQVLDPQQGRRRGLVPPIDDPTADVEDLFNQFLNRRPRIPDVNSRQLKINPNEAFFVLCEVDKKEVFEGEQIVTNWYLYTRGNIMTLDRVKFPELRGFWKEIIEEVPALNFTEEIVNGIPYRKALLASHALFPIKPGSAVIDEYKIKAQVQVPTNPMSVFGFGKPYSFNRSSERISIKVNPLPLEGKPTSFSGAVGQFEVRSSIESNQFSVGQPFLLKIRFEGKGNAKLIELPSLNLPTTLEIYDTKSDAKFFKDGRSYKEFEVLLIPRAEGELKIPALELGTFDPIEKKYLTKKTEEFVLQILPGAAGGIESLAALPLKTQNSATPSLQLPDLIRAPDLRAQNFEIQPEILWSSLYLLILAVLLNKARLIFGWGARKQTIQRALEKRLKKVDQLIQQDQWRSVGTELINCIYFVLGQLTEQGGASFQSAKLLEMIPPSIRSELGLALEKVIERNQILSFAPEGVVTALRTRSELEKNKAEVEKLLYRAIAIAQFEPEIGENRPAES